MSAFFLCKAGWLIRFDQHTALGSGPTVPLERDAGININVMHTLESMAALGIDTIYYCIELGKSVYLASLTRLA